MQQDSEPIVPTISEEQPSSIEQNSAQKNSAEENSVEQEVENKEEIMKRRQERSLVFFLLYAMDSWGYEVALSELVENLNIGFDTEVKPDGLIVSMAMEVIEKRSELDEAIKPLLAHWRIERLGVCTLLILRLAVWEFLHTETPPQIIMNEAIELAKCFAEKDAYRFVNGVLDELSKRLQKEKSPEGVEVAS